LIFAAMTTAYIIVGIRLEERDLRSAFGSDYEEYQKQVSMILPWVRKGVKS
jgi:protein-S-isoprenylcysteine O-methyltransferase Ste14